jgi:hypothetical protein
MPFELMMMSEMESSSGGVFGLLADFVFEKGGYVCVY